MATWAESRAAAAVIGLSENMENRLSPFPRMNLIKLAYVRLVKDIIESEEE